MSSERLNKILENLFEQHNNGGTFDREEHKRKQCEWDNATEGHLNEQDGYNCDICKNKGFVYFLKESEYTGHNEITARECKCMQIRRTLRRAKESGLNNILTDYTFAKYEAREDWQKNIKSKAQSFCDDEAAHWFYIGGQTGAGKSHICTAICAHYIKAGKNVRYMLWRDDAVKLKSVASDFEQYQKQIFGFKTVDVLYIDDFLKVKDGTEPTTADINLAFEILNYRLLDSDKITIISSEYTINKALAFDEATIGRIYQQAGDYKISIDRDINKNYRLK